MDIISIIEINDRKTCFFFSKQDSAIRGKHSSRWYSKYNKVQYNIISYHIIVDLMNLIHFLPQVKGHNGISSLHSVLLNGEIAESNKKKVTVV